MILDADLILPCLDEGPALAGLLPALPPGLQVIVVDNGSSDDTAQVARDHGALVVHEPRRGYGAAVHAGLLAATARYVVVMDGDGSIDPGEIVPLLAHLRFDSVDLVLGRRVPVRRGLVPWHARLGNRLVLAVLRRRTRLAVHDLGPVRASRRDMVLELGVKDRGMGYPLELLDKASRAGWRISEVDVRYLPRAAGTHSKVSGSMRGTLRTGRDFWRVLRCAD
ncbi:MAG: glycosyltransferase family 2 protein [Mycobacterium sp.]